MEFPQICPFWVKGLNIFFETLQYDTAQQLAKSDLNIHKSHWTFRKARHSLFYLCDPYPSNNYMFKVNNKVKQ